MTHYMNDELDSETLFYLLRNPSLFVSQSLYYDFVQRYFPSFVERHPQLTQSLVQMYLANEYRRRQERQNQRMFELNFKRVSDEINRNRRNKRLPDNLNVTVQLNNILHDTAKRMTSEHRRQLDYHLNRIQKDLDKISKDGLIKNVDIKNNPEIQELRKKHQQQIQRQNKRIEKNKENRVKWMTEQLQENPHKYKVWQQTPNPKTRHTETNGQKVKLEEQFIVINDKTGDIDYVDYPGDWTCSPSNKENCLCNITFTNNPTGYKPQHQLKTEYQQQAQKIKQQKQFMKDKQQYLIQNEKLPDYITDDSEYTFSKFGDKLFIKLNLNKRMRKIGDKYNDTLYNKISEKFNSTISEYKKIEGTLKHKAIHIWTGNKHQIFNQWIKRGKEALFNKVPLELEEDTHKLFKNIKKDLISQETPMDTNIVVFKGTTEELGIHSEGNELKFTEFTATSLNEQTAKNFIRNKNGKRYIYEIHIPKGTKIIPILQQGSNPHQSEILLSENHTFIEGQRYKDPYDENTIRVPILLTS